MSNELLQKVVDTTDLGPTGANTNGGLLNPEQSNRFIDYMWDATVLANEGRKIRMRSDTVEIEKVNVGQKIVRLATEAVDDGVNADATFTKISITTKKLRLDWELSSEALEDGIEGEQLEDTIVRLMATALGNDLEDLAINGDTTNTGDPLYKAFDGFKKLASTAGHTVSAGGAALSLAVFNKAIRAMPRKYLQRRNELKFYVGSGLQQDYIYSLASVATFGEQIAGAVIGGSNATAGGAGHTTAYAFGIPVKEVPYMKEDGAGTYSGAVGDHGDLELTFPKNRLWGIKREITVHREFKPKKDTIEYTVFTRFGVQIENGDAWVTVTNVKAAAA